VIWIAINASRTESGVVILLLHLATVAFVRAAPPHGLELPVSMAVDFKANKLLRLYSLHRQKR
jgi:hypothetical protein